MKLCFNPADILLPAKEINKEKWAVIACDQYTSQPDYWKEVENIVQDEPSTLHLVYPEVYLDEGDQRIQTIHQAMKHYLEDQTLVETIHQGFVLVSRQIASGNRLGLIGLLDLEDYDYTPGSQTLIRATEGTIQSRIPPRMKIREGAPIESPHIMLLVDDPQQQLIEPLFENRQQYETLYDIELMQNGGHLSGYAITGDAAKQTVQKIANMQAKSNGFFLAVGDGNHSLATAKACWEKIKVSLDEAQKENHPARYALVEVVNLHSPALVFEPIHRILFHTDLEQLTADFQADLLQSGIETKEGRDIVFVQNGKEVAMSLSNTKGRIPVDVLQNFLDRYLEKHPDIKIDYIHGHDDLVQLANKGHNCGILLGSIHKENLFTAIAAGGVLPRKTFSMGEAYEKRYYMECRKL